MGDTILDKTVSSIVDSDEIAEFAGKHGTSGAQHGGALALAKQHLRHGSTEGGEHDE